MCVRACVAGGSHCLFNSCCCCTSASLPARETRVARPSRSRSSSRRGGTEQPDTKRGTGIPPAACRPPAAPPGFGDTPRRRPRPAPPGPPGTGPGARRGARELRGSGPARGGWAGPPGRVGCGAARVGGGGALGLELSALPREPPAGRRGAGNGGGEAGSPVFPWGGGPWGLTPPGRTGSLLFLSRGGRVPPSPPPPPGVPIGRVPGTPARAAQTRPARSGGWLARGVGARRGPRASSLLPPSGLSLPPRGPPLPASVPPFRLPLLLLSALLSS